MSFKVNSFVRAVLESHLRYDNDVKITEQLEDSEEIVEYGAKVQWKQILGIGVLVEF